MKRGNWTDKPCYYVSVADVIANDGTARRVGLLAGPFKTHQQALDRVQEAREIGEAADPWAHFYAFGTCKMKNGHTEGKLNSSIGIEQKGNPPVTSPTNQPNHPA